MLYPKNKDKLTPELFLTPTAEYRGTPFWAWNATLDADELCRQIEHFKAMGLGGFHMHVRTGMATPYLSDDFMQLIRTCVDKARELDMLAWLYDEDRWPSGAAGGFVTANPEFRARHLLWTATPESEAGHAAAGGDSSARAGRSGNGRLLACYQVQLDEQDYLSGYQRIEPDAAGSQDGTVWYAYLETALPSPWYNNETYVDTLNPRAIAKFIETTHERYAETVGSDFGGIIPAIFTDEPQFTHKTTLRHAAGLEDLVMPWTDDLAESFAGAYGFDLLDRLPELVWELPQGRLSHARYAYHDHIAQRFTEAFADQCGAWCRGHNLMLTGHMMEEPTLQSQTAALGEAMRSYRGFDLPGIDMLCNYYEYTTAKQAQSAARQFGNPGVLSELYGVTNWDFDFRGHKLQGDWQAALGVTVRVQHLSWYAMAGEAKRDYPASIHYQSSWSRQYPLIEDHFARVNTAMTRGRAVSRIGVIHPVESFWLCWGPLDQTAARREQLDQQFAQLTDWLLFGQLDFDFISESLLPQQCTTAGNPLQVGEMAYERIIVPDVLTLRASTLERLAAFQAAGGEILCLGDAPSYIDGQSSDAAAPLYASARRVNLSQTALLEALEPVRDLDLIRADGRRADHWLYQLRQDGDQRWLFIAQGKDPGKVDQPQAEALTLRLCGLWQGDLYRTLDGSVEPVAGYAQHGQTCFDLALYEHDSVLLRLRPADTAAAAEAKTIMRSGRNDSLTTVDTLSGPADITLDEPNVLLLDQAEYRLDQKDWQPSEEILRADNDIRHQLGWPTRESRIAQPWTVADPPHEHTVSLRFTIETACTVKSAKLALEDAGLALLVLDGQPLATTVDGWYVDRSIATVGLPDLAPGRHQLEITWPFNQRSQLEWCYLLGDFSVRLNGARAVIEPPVRTVNWGNLTRQGFPFYGGALTYTLTAHTQGGPLAIHVPLWRAGHFEVLVDGKRQSPIVFSPYTVTTEPLAAGDHRVELRLYASRVNSFGCVHNCDRSWSWFGPDAWRTTGDAWAYEYQLRELGILKSPVLECV